MDTIIGIAIIVTLFLIIDILDRKSTFILYKFNRMVRDDQKRNKWFEYAKQQDELKNELNTSAQKFMRKFGIERGMIMHSLVIGIPFLVSIVLVIYFGIIPLWVGFVVLAFMFGQLYSQFITSYTYSQRCKKIGIELG